MTLLHILLPGIYSLLFLLSYRDPVVFLEFFISVYFGFGLLFLDRLLHIFYIESETPFSQSVRESWRQKDVRKVLRSVFYAGQMQERLITRSVFFLVAYAATALFVITSTGSVIGTGIILGVGLHYCFDFWQYRKNLESLHQHFLWQFRRKLAEREVTSFFLAMCAFFVLLSLLAFAGR